MEDYIAKLKENPDYIWGKRAPSYETMKAWEDKGIAKATDGCVIESDGTCKHGAKSWLLIRRLI